MYSGQQIYEMFKAGRIEPLEFAHQFVRQLAVEFEDEASALQEAQGQMMTYWEGDSADAAGKGIMPLIQAHMDSAPLIEESSQSISTQSNVYSDSQRRVIPVPSEPEKPSPWAVGASMIVPGIGDPVGSYRDGMAAHNEANATNVRVMEQYSGVTSDTSRSLPDDYGVIEDDGAAIFIGTRASSAIIEPTTMSPNVNSPGGGLAPGVSSGVSGNYGGAPGVNAPGGGSAPAPGGGGLPGGGASGALPPAAGVVGGSGGGGGNTPMRPGGPGMLPPIAGVAGKGGDTERSGRSAGSRPPAGTARAGGRMTGAGGGAPKANAANIARGGAAAAGKVAGTGGGLPSGGKSAGAGMPAGSGGQPGAAAAKAGGMAGARGGMGGGMAGAGAGRGQGDDDKEHKDKYFVKEELDDGLQVELDEHGHKTVDEQGNTVVPPVIGEPDYQPGDPGK